jgi:release factor glutamine methyltransferase
MARDAAVLLLSRALNIPAARLVSHAETPVSMTDAERVYRLARRWASGEPLAYLVGNTWFFRREFLVDPRVLIPRPETEHLIDAVIAHRPNRVLDVGTGSGAIACTIAAELPQARVDAVDISEDALAVARENARRLNVAVAFYHGDLFEPVANRTYDAIVANLPYVPSGAGDPDLRFEPSIALFAGADGLDAYRRFFALVPPFVNSGGLVLAEGAPPTAPGLLALARAAFPHARVSMERDYGGRDRFVKVETPS